MSADGLHPGELSGDTILPPSRFFTSDEFTCRDGTPYPLALRSTWIVLVTLCDAVRERWANPLAVVSGYRSPAYNAALVEASDERGAHQVASGSLHVVGEAADLRPLGGGDASMLHRMIMADVEFFRALGLNGLGLYPRSNWVHVDVRPKPPDGHLARWLGT